MILAARRINSRMGLHVAHQVMRLMASARIHVVGSRILVMGLTFKENCPDLRNTRVLDIVEELRGANATVDVWDPVADPVQAEKHLGAPLVASPEAGAYDAIVLAVAHDEVRALGAEGVRALGRGNAIVFDVKSVLPVESVQGRL